MKHQDSLFLAAALTVATAALTTAHYLTHDYWHRRLPNRLYRQVQQILAAKGQISGGYIDMTPAAGYVRDRLVASYHGGVNLATASGAHAFEFDIAEDGTVLALAQVA